MAVRHSTVKHLGRRTEEEKREQAERESIHNVRSLDVLLSNCGANLDSTQRRQAIKAVQHWLMDVEHSFRMKGDENSQDVVINIKNLLEG